MSLKKISKNQLIKSESNSLARAGNTLKITDKILEENNQRLIISEIKSVKIGDQIWMTENLNLDRFRNGDPIPEARTDEEWETAGKKGQPAWCYYDNDAANGELYGKLYNWYAVSDHRGLAPIGWQVPSHNDWIKLVRYFEYQFTDDKMIIPNENVDYTLNYKDDSILSLETVGYKDLSPGFCSGTSFYWSSTETGQNNINGIEYISHSKGIWVLGLMKDFQFGLSVRCLKNTSI